MAGFSEIYKKIEKTIDFIEKRQYNRKAHVPNTRTGGVIMPNIKSAKKRVELSKVAYEKNKAEKTQLKTIIKKFEAALVGVCKKPEHYPLGRFLYDLCSFFLCMLIKLNSN